VLPFEKNGSKPAPKERFNLDVDRGDMINLFIISHHHSLKASNYRSTLTHLHLINRAERVFAKCSLKGALIFRFFLIGTGFVGEKGA
jgi:hypothetical protein